MKYDFFSCFLNYILESRATIKLEKKNQNAGNSLSFVYKVPPFIACTYGVLYLFPDKFPPSLSVPLECKSILRYGENPHQTSAFYVDKRLAEVNAGGIATAIQHHGKVRSTCYCMHLVTFSEC